MDLGGDQRRPVLVETPRRWVWPLIFAILIAGVAAGWILLAMLGRWADSLPEPTMQPVKATPAQVAAAAEAAARNPGGPRWGTVPVPTYPVGVDQSVEARVMINCVIQGDRTLGDCRIVEEAPLDRGFGQSALDAARKARVIGDDAVGERVQFTIRYLPPRD
ncbi:energy transducer TonB [Brevundimonas lenta]|uniref:TonB C-terminal domain-containing protein n=1 Tax=Brevundimonas lenta TaxID=424796 RepID=A0A7W6JBJ4_9CAUL|nr:energy transducer TonB [Brevundimonas lenta]MBB4082086.1 hypothetical protein [Brevundimonas lenta]